MNRLEQSGIFKARPLGWEVYEARSGAVGISIEFRIVSELNESSEWHDWSEYEPHRVFGTWWVVRKDGGLNQAAVDQLVECLGWSGDLMDVSIKSPNPETIVQITVKDEEYDGKTRYRASWMNPEDFQPTGFGVSEDDVRKLNGRFGGLLKAAAAGAGAQKKAAASKKKPGSTQQQAAGTATETHPDDDIPF